MTFLTYRSSQVRTSIVFLFFVLLLGCDKENPFTPIFDVPEEFKPIVETFQMEALARGYDYDIKNLIIRYDEAVEDIYCATCNSIAMDNNIQKIISVRPQKCWLNEQQKEALVFHELGHCFLGRDHENSLLPNGDPKSMMVENNISVYSGCTYVIGNVEDCNFVFKRTYYLDELFNENTPVPDWAK